MENLEIKRHTWTTVCCFGVLARFRAKKYRTVNSVPLIGFIGFRLTNKRKYERAAICNRKSNYRDNFTSVHNREGLETEENELMERAYLPADPALPEPDPPEPHPPQLHLPHGPARICNRKVICPII